MSFDPDFLGVSVFCDVNDRGEIIDALTGRNIVADRQYDFFFFVEEDIAKNIDDYKVVLNGLKADLILK